MSDRDALSGVTVIPAGVAHHNIGQSGDLLVVGAYPDGGDDDIRCGAAHGYEAAKRSAAAVSPRVADPVGGPEGFLPDLW